MRFLKNIAPLLIIIGASLFIRIVLPYDKIFTDVGVKFDGVDAYYHMRIVDNLVANFPHMTFYDPYYILPNGTYLTGQYFFDWLLAGVAWVIGLGHPAQHLVDVVGAYFPAVLGALVVIPVFYISKTLFDRTVGLVASALIAVFAGEFLGRSMLGSTDYHIAEVLFSTAAVLFVILAIKSASKKRVIYSLLAGLFLGTYLLTWAGGLLFVFIISAYFIIQAIIDHMRHENRLNVIGLIIFPIVLLMNFKVEAFPKVAVYTLTLASLLPLLLFGLSWVMRKLAVGYYPLALAVLGGCVLLLTPSTLTSFSIFLASGESIATTSELRPMFYPRGSFSTFPAWSNYTTSWFLAPVALLMITLTYIRQKGKTVLFLLVWTLVITILAVIQVRYAYYLSINVAIIMGFLCANTYQWFGKISKPKQAKKSKIVRKNYAVLVIAGVAIFFVVVFPNFARDGKTTKVEYVPTNAWQNALSWMRDNTPEPFNGGDVYYTEYPLNPDNMYVKPDYAVTSWWDYGYWITRIAHRVPNTNPAQSPEPIKKVAELLLSNSEANDALQEFKTKYIMLDFGLMTSKFSAVGEWVGKPVTQYMDMYYVKENNQMRMVVLFYPEYYKTLAVRLYNFDGEAASEQAVVVTYEKRGGDKVITGNKIFDNYNEAVKYAAQVSGIVVSTNPFVSPIPLESLQNYKLIHSSGQVNSSVGSVPEVKIFEYAGGNG